MKRRTIARVGHPFFSKERSVLSVLFRSFLKNGTFFPFFSVLFKRTERSFRSFPFFSKERNVLSVLFRSLQKNVPFFPFFSVPLKRTERSFYVLFTFFSWPQRCPGQRWVKKLNYICNYIARKKNVTFSRSFCKRTKRSCRSFGVS